MPWKGVGRYSSGMKIFLLGDPGWSLASFALSWSATGGQDSACLQRACLPVLIRNAVCVFSHPSKSKHWRQQGHCAPSNPVTLIRPSWHNASWSLLSRSTFLTNPSLISNCFLTPSTALLKGRSSDQCQMRTLLSLVPWCLKARADLHH